MAKKLETTSVGTAVYPRVNAPDTKFVKDPTDKGHFSIKLEQDLADPKAAALRTRIDEAIDEQLALAKKEFKPSATKKKFEEKHADKPYVIDEDTNKIIFSFKQKAGGTVKAGPRAGTVWTATPAIFDAKGKPCKPVPKIGGGTKCKVSFEFSPFYTGGIGAGVSLKLNGVQIIELVEWGQNAASFGFEEEEGYSATESEETASETFPADDPAATGKPGEEDF